MEAIGLFQTPCTANIINVGSSQVATSQDLPPSATDYAVIIRNSDDIVSDVNTQEVGIVAFTWQTAVLTRCHLRQWLMTQEKEGSNKWTIQNKKSSKYASPQGPVKSGTAVVEDDNSYLWRIVSADDGSGGNL